MTFSRGSLATRMAILFSALLAGIGVFMTAFFPRKMAQQAESSTIDRATSIAQVMSTAIAPSIEFEDHEHARTVLGWLEAMPDARFAMLSAANATEFVSWHPERIPPGQTWQPDRPETAAPGGSEATSVELAPHLLLVSVPVRGLAGARGMLHVGFSLEALERERDDAEHIVALVAALVTFAGVLATLFVARLIVRPIHRITATARRISRGELPPVLPAPHGFSEIIEMSEALRSMLERINEVSQQKLVRASRHAGMAEVATGVLHNVGNVLNSVNVSIELMREHAAAHPIARVRQLHALLAGAEASTFDAARLDATRRYVEVVAQALERTHATTIADLDVLRGHVDHIKRVVAMQNAYARRGGVLEDTRVGAVIDEAIELACPPARRGRLALEVDAVDAPVKLDRSRAVQVLVNLLTNARDAVADAEQPRVVIAARLDGDTLTVVVTDNGKGWKAEVGAELFGAGFTTKADGHGYGLHSSALAARQMGGSLSAHSDGPGLGARFTLVIGTIPGGTA